MANIKSAIKRVRQTAKRNLRNKQDKSKMRSACKKVLSTVESGEVTAAQEALRQAVSVLAISAQKGLIHKNCADRRTHRLNLRVKQLAQATAA